MSGKAVVVGASIAGLAAARVLSDRYESDVVLECDELLVVPPDRLMRPRVVRQALLHGRRPARP
jgi:flavin-dependent dehydrogenase